jgi:hypothetical protein
MPLVEIIQWVSVGLSITGMLLVTYKKRVGFIFWTIASLTWLYVFYMKEVGPRMIVEGIYAATAVYGFWKWGRDKKF